MGKTESTIQADEFNRLVVQAREWLGRGEKLDSLNHAKVLSHLGGGEWIIRQLLSELEDR